MRGSAIDSRRSRNSHIRSPRNVTLAPIGMPSRSLNCAMDLRARCTSGFWPVIAVRSRTAPSISFASRAASPTPMLTTTFTTPGICMTLSYENCSRSPGAISSAYRCLSRGTGWVGAVIFRSSAGAARLGVVADQHCRVLVEADVRPVRAAPLLGGADHDRPDDVALLDAGAGQRVLDGSDDDVADPGVPAAGTAEHPDAEDLLRTRVVSHAQARLLLDHSVRPISDAPSARLLTGAPKDARCARILRCVTWPSPGSPRSATAWWPTAGASPSPAPGHRRRRRSARRAP